MNSLVGYGVSSESDSEGDVDDVNNDKTGSRREVSEEAAATSKTRNFLLESGSASSESGSESEPEEEDTQPSPPPPPHPPPAAATTASSAPCRPTLPAPSLSALNPSKLPPPTLEACSDSSVFANPFKAQADQKLSALQKHVPLTMQAKPSQIGGKRMCVAYRKDGRCRFGIKCKFAHDSDLQTSVIPGDIRPSLGTETPVSAQVDSHAGGSFSGGSHRFHEEAEEEETEGQQGRKRRAGLSNTLIPPKRAMKQYVTQRDKERLSMS
ncbi:uncharacterized protein LOC115360320 [Myripristis murdjan]|uniref:uncharacterized protein LOC115360320 n=1 Tax=Myripristis murdjan TaxID=586833 RepID=UPI0011763C8C|nr:uncharacterized protein LOC115360320 [Myripristis murdjan]